MPPLPQIVTLSLLGVGLLFLILGIALRSWYVISTNDPATETTGSSTAGLWNICYEITSTLLPSSTGGCYSYADYVAIAIPTGTKTNSYNQCVITSDSVLEHVRAAQAFAIIDLLVAVALVVAVVVSLFFKPLPRFVSPILVALVVLCTIIATASYYNMSHCFLAKESSHGGGAIALFWIGTIFLAAGGLIPFIKPSSEASTGAYSSI